MNKRNSILESLSEGMLNKTSQVNDVKRTKNGDMFAHINNGSLIISLLLKS